MYRQYKEDLKTRGDTEAFEDPLPVVDMALKTVVFQGSCREGRMGARVVKMVTDELEKRKHSVTVIDQKDLEDKGLSLLRQPLHFYPDPSKAPEVLIELNTALSAADALIFVTAEYNATCPPGLLNLIDHFPPPSFAYKPAAVIAYSMGPFGGLRAAAALLPVLSEVGAATTPSRVCIPTVQNALTEDGVPDERVAKNLDKSLTQLEWYADALRAKKLKNGIPK